MLLVPLLPSRAPTMLVSSLPNLWMPFKCAANTSDWVIAGCFTPGSFTNYITHSFKEPCLIIITDPCVDYQAISEASDHGSHFPVQALYPHEHARPKEYRSIGEPRRCEMAVGGSWNESNERVREERSVVKRAHLQIIDLDLGCSVCLRGTAGR